MDQRTRYRLTKLNGRVVVTDSQVANLTVVTEDGIPADITNPDHVRFFGMTEDTALRVRAAAESTR